MKDYYLILELPRAADKKRIKEAYRKKAKELHPDQAGASGNTQKFMEAKEAYETLADDAKRAEYDRKLENRKNKGTQIPVNKTSQTGRSRRKHSRSSFSDAGSGAGADHFKNRSGWRLELILNPLEARSGGRFPVSVPVRRPCPRCSSRSLIERMFCPLCFGEGVVYYEKTVAIEVEPCIEDGARIEQLADERCGIRTWLDVKVRISPEA